MEIKEIVLGEYRFFIHEIDDKDVKLLLEAKHKGTPLVGQYSFIKHQPHNPTGEYHLHLYKKQNEIFSINKSGGGHDGSSGKRIPNDVFNALKQKFPDWTWPENQIIESISLNEFQAKRMNQPLRPVLVFQHRYEGNLVESFEGYFHRFADDPFQTGGSGGFFAKTIALIENHSGYISKVPVSSFRFTDREEEL